MSHCLRWVLGGIAVLSALVCSAPAAEDKPQDIKIFQQWQGLYPVKELSRLPEGQRDTSAGFIANPQDFARIWTSFKANEKAPEVDFQQHIILFVRNTQFLNSTRVFKVTLTAGLLEPLAIETRSAKPIGTEVYMALVEIPREGAKAVKCGDKQVNLPAPPADSATPAPKDPVKPDPKDPVKPPAPPTVVEAVSTTPVAEPDSETVTGVIDFKEPAKLGPDTVVEVVLLDVTPDDNPDNTLGKQLIKAPQAVPIAFTVPYNPRVIHKQHSYTVAVRVLNAGNVEYITDTFWPVITQGSPSRNIRVPVTRANQS
jgi:putative lipoprotein